MKLRQESTDHEKKTDASCENSKSQITDFSVPSFFSMHIKCVVESTL